MSRATNHAPNADANAPEKSYFEQQRAVLLRDIGESLEQVLQNLNKLNRSLEGVTAVGNEFSAVEALWSHFENVMAKQPDQSESEKPPTGDSAQDTPSQTPSNAKR